MNEVHLVYTELIKPDPRPQIQLTKLGCYLLHDWDAWNLENNVMYSNTMGSYKTISRTLTCYHPFVAFCGLGVTLLGHLEKLSLENIKSYCRS